MAFKEVEKNLQAITRRYLQTTRHAANDGNYQKWQFRNVAEALASQSKDTPQLLEILDSGVSVVPAMSEITRAHMENIGTSSVLCLDYLACVGPEEIIITEDLRKLIQKFFEKAIEQAKKACVHYDQAASPSPEQLTYEKRLIGFFEESVNDIEKRRKLVEKDLEAAEHAAAQAKAAAELAQRIADSAKTEANIATQAANAASEASTKAQQNADTAQKTIGSVQKIANEAKKNAKSALESSQHAEEQASALIPNMLTVLGIFVGIIIAVVACYLSILLAPNGADATNGIYSRPFEFMQFLLMGHVMLGVVFLLLYLVSKLTSHTLTCPCKRFKRDATSSDTSNFNCSECEKKCSSPARLRLRYPYVFGINLVFTIGYCCLGLWQIINVYYRRDLDNLIANYPLPSLLGFVGLAIIPVIVICVVFKRPK